MRTGRVPECFRPYCPPSRRVDNSAREVQWEKGNERMKADQRPSARKSVPQKEALRPDTVRNEGEVKNGRRNERLLNNGSRLYTSGRYDSLRTCTTAAQGVEMARRQAERETIFNKSEKGKEKKRGRKKIRRVWGGLALGLSVLVLVLPEPAKNRPVDPNSLTVRTQMTNHECGEN